MKFMLLMMTPHNGWQAFNTMPAHDIKAHIEFMIRTNAELSKAGELVDAQGLAMADQAKIVRADERGAPVLSDGPFAETKEFLAGYWIVDVETPARAFEIAAHISTAPGRDGVPMRFPVEVRQVMQAPPV
jgi:hypothetical protein